MYKEIKYDIAVIIKNYSLNKEAVFTTICKVFHIYNNSNYIEIDYRLEADNKSYSIPLTFTITHNKNNVIINFKIEYSEFYKKRIDSIISEIEKLANVVENELNRLSKLRADIKLAAGPAVDLAALGVPVVK